jgi:uncharacterized repeat protein (TIGR01451 family)
MLTRRTAAVVAAIATLGILWAALAPCWAAEDKSLLERLDDFGKSIFDGILPPEKPKTSDKKASNKKSSAQRSDDRVSADDPWNEPNAPRAGSILSDPPQRAKSKPRAKPAETEEYLPEERELDYPRGADGAPKPVRKPAADRSLLEDLDDNVVRPVARPLHQRMNEFRESVFGAEQQHDARQQPDVASGRQSLAQPNANDRLDDPRAAPPAASGPLTAERRSGISRPKTGNDFDYLPGENDSLAAENRSAKTQPKPQPRKQHELLIARRGPALGVETVGPNTIAVGKESSYEVNIVNSGETEAEGLVVFVTLPAWTELAGATASVGDAETAPADQPAGTIRWNVGRLPPKARERLTVKIIPRQSKPFDLAVRWDYKPAASKAMIEVQEPKLTLKLDGPREVQYGKKELFRLILSNTGTGDAEDVVLALTPVGAGQNVSASHKVGLLAAGEEKTLEVELTARQAGELTIKVEVHDDGQIRAELAEKVLVRRAALKTTIEGPKVLYVGAAMNYTVSVSNPGNAAAKNVVLSIAFPPGVKYISGVDHARWDAATGKLSWTLENLPPEAQRNFVLKCGAEAAGVCPVRLSAKADDDLTAAAETTTRVEAVASLTMEVIDPAGPAPVGEETLYQVRVRNRGTKEARGVEVFAYFSRGIEPTAADGAAHRLGPGQVVFDPIESIAPGEERVLKVRAKAEIAGNHVFRAEAHCKPLGARLISEATNLYYGDAAGAEQTAREPSALTPAR